MIDLTTVTTTEQLLNATMWAFIVYGLAQALFRSFWAKEIKSRLGSRESDRQTLANRALWELRYQTPYDSGAAKRDDMAATRKLTEQELRERSELVRKIRRETVSIRAIMYFFSCMFCQCFWTAFAVYLLSTSLNVATGFASSVGYAAFCLLISRLLAQPAPARQQEAQGDSRGCPSGNCGGGK